MTSRFFHALVVLGAAISAGACGGKSESTSSDDGAGSGAGGAGGTAAGGAGTTQGGSGGTAAGGTGAGTGGSLGGTGGTGGDIALGGTGGMQPTGPFPEPGPTAQWDCEGPSSSQPNGPFHQGCVDVLGVTAEHLIDDCPVNPTFPKSATDCASDELLSCHLAVTVAGVPVLINCTCQHRYEYSCLDCNSLNSYNGYAVSCTPELKICECAYTGILR